MASTLRVACAILRNEAGQILLCRRAPGRRESGLWEFPGGKIETGETPAQALHRELQEELNLLCHGEEECCRVSHTYSHGTIELIAIHVAGHAQNPILKDHDLLAWAWPHQLLSYELAPADIPIARYLQGSRGLSQTEKA